MKHRDAGSLQLIVITFIGLINLFGYAQFSAMGDFRQHMAYFYVLQAVLTAGYFFILLPDKKTDLRISATNAGQFNNRDIRILILILAFAAAYRIIMLFDYPYLTDDIFRYIWDGRVWGHGINPYRFPPADPALAPLRDAYIYPQVNHPHIPTIYAPLLQLLFRITAAVSPGIFAFKVMVVIFDCGTIWLLLLLLRHWQIPRQRIIIYAWNPLAIIEIAGSGHLDGIGIFFLLLAIYLLQKRQAMLSGLGLAMAILVKFVPLLLLPFAIKNRSTRWKLLFISASGLLILFAYTPFLHAGLSIFKAMFVYADKWRFNDSIFNLIFNFFDAILPEAAVKFYIHSKGMIPDLQSIRTMRTDLILLLSKGLAGVILLYIFACLYRWHNQTGRPMHERTLLRIWMIIFGAMCILSPTLHPWYLLWILPLTVFEREKAWLVLSITILWSYEIVFRFAATGIWEENGWVKLAVFLPFYAVLIFEIFRRKDIFTGILRSGLRRRKTPKIR